MHTWYSLLNERAALWPCWFIIYIDNPLSSQVLCGLLWARFIYKYQENILTFYAYRVIIWQHKEERKWKHFIVSGSESLSRRWKGQPWSAGLSSLESSAGAESAWQLFLTATRPFTTSLRTGAVEIPRHFFSCKYSFINLYKKRPIPGRQSIKAG